MTYDQAFNFIMRTEMTEENILRALLFVFVFSCVAPLWPIESQIIWLGLKKKKKIRMEELALSTRTTEVAN